MNAAHSLNLEVYNAIKFRNSLAGPSSANVFFTIGRSVSWANDSSPDTAVTSIASFNDIWQQMIGGKRITSYDVNLCIPRANWTEGTVYDQYDDIVDDKVLKNYSYYVLTDEWNVYKCISNNNGAESTDKPTSTLTTGTFTTADEYVWKYMYTVSSSDRLRFTTDTFLPITVNHTVVEQAIPGEISSIIVTNPGENYSNTLQVSIAGDGTGAAGYAVWDDANNNILKVVITDHGSGYTYANAVITANTGSNATARVVLSPPGGHGSDPYDELGASYVIINPQLKYDENGKLITENDYRQVALIEGPFIYSSTTQSSNSAFNQTTIMSVTGVSSNFENDERVYQGTDLSTSTFSAIVSKWDSTNGVIYLTNTRGIPKSDVLIGDTSTARRYVTSITYPDLQPRTGRLLYMDNILPVERADDQTDSFQIILKF